MSDAVYSVAFFRCFKNEFDVESIAGQMLEMEVGKYESEGWMYYTKHP